MFPWIKFTPFAVTLITLSLYVNALLQRLVDTLRLPWVQFVHARLHCSVYSAHAFVQL